MDTRPLRTRVRPAAALVLCALSVTGCMKKSDGQRLMAQAQEHERRLSELEEGLATERRELGEAVAQAHTKVEELQEVLTQATAVVTRNSADVGAQVEELQGQLATLQGQLAELENSLRETRGRVDEQGQQLEGQLRRFARSAGVEVALEEREIPSDPSALLQAARQAQSAGQGGRARALFTEFVRRHHDDDQADDAQLAIGQSYLGDRQPARALGALQKVIQDFPQGDAVDDALFSMGEAFFALHACTDARSAFETLLRAHPRSPLARRARAKIREIRHAGGSACTS